MPSCSLYSTRLVTHSNGQSPVRVANELMWRQRAHSFIPENPDLIHKPLNVLVKYINSVRMQVVLECCYTNK